MASMLRVRNFEKFQHYGQNRTPPWIKLHRSVLTDYEFRKLPDHAKAQLMLLWLVASGCNNALHDDAEWLQSVTGSRTPIEVELLLSAGFIERYTEGARKQRASKPLAARKQDATLDKTRLDKTRLEESAAVLEAAPPAPGWVPQAVDRWAQWVGIIPHGRMGRELAPAVKVYGEAAVLAAISSFGEWRRDKLADFGDKVPGLPHFVANLRSYIPHNLLKAAS